jgi:nitroreductase
MEVLNPANCNGCGHCRAICPADAPRLEGMVEAEYEPSPSPEEIPSPAAFLRFARSRRSVRRYKDRPVEEEKLWMIVEAGRFAPTGGNRQGIGFAVFRGRKVLDRVCYLAGEVLRDKGKRLREAREHSLRLKQPLPEEYRNERYAPEIYERFAGQWEKGVDRLLHHAPALILLHRKRGIVPRSELEVGIASAHMVLMAETLGLGTCYIGFLITAVETSEELGGMLKIPADHQAHAALTLGYPQLRYRKLVARNPARVEWIEE